MLKLKHLYENYDLAKFALQSWRHDADTLDDILPQFRISANAIYPYFEDGQVCLLRLAPVDEKLERNVLGEMAFITYLRENGFPALEPIPSKDGRLCLTLNTAWGVYYATAFRRVKGCQIEDVEWTPYLLTEYGRTLGRLHALSAAYTPTVRKWSHADALDWMEATLAEYKAPDVAVSELNAVRRALARLPQTAETYGLVHYDFEPDNVFYDDDTKTCAVIDFDDGMYHWYALDIEQAFASLAEALEGEALAAAEDAFLRGYRLERPFTDDMAQSRPLMRRFVNLYGYARLIRAVAEKFDDEPEWLVNLRAKLGGAIAQKESSMRGESA